jgi:uncharacterized repeat protein (TIGR02543 family)
LGSSQIFGELFTFFPSQTTTHPFLQNIRVSNGVFTANFYHGNTNFQVGGTLKTTTQLRTASTFTSAGWDFTNVWAIEATKNDGYPYLRHQYQYGIAYVAPDRTGGNLPTDNTRYPAGASATVLSAGTLSRTGYCFTGWNTKADGTGTSYAVGSTLVLPAENVTLYVQWTPIHQATIGTVADVLIGSASFQVSYTLTSGTATHYSLSSNLPNFVAVNNAPLAGSPITVSLPANTTLGTFNFVLALRNQTTGCVESYPFAVTVYDNASPTERRGNALKMNGINQFATTSNVLSTATQNVTIETWVKIDAYPTTNALIAYNGDAVGGNGYGLLLGTGGKLFALNSGVNIFENPFVTLPLNTWMHIAYTIENTNVVRVFLNGMQIMSPAMGAFTPSGTFKIGDTHFVGEIDEVRFWNVARTANEIRSTMHLTLPTGATNLTNYYQFNDTNATLASDWVGNMPATFQNAPIRVGSGANVSKGTSFAVVAPTAGVDYQFTGTGVTLNFGTGTTGNIVVSRLEGLPTGEQVSGANTVHTRYYWVINNDWYGAVNTGLNVTATFVLGAGQVSTQDATTPSNLKLNKRPSNLGGAWSTVINASSATASTGTIQFTGIDGFSEFVISSSGTSPLPITLLGLKGERVEGLRGEMTEQVRLEWATASEINNKGFEVEMSQDGLAYEKIAFVEGKGNSTTIQPYSHTTIQPYDSYYRLKQVDFDGKFSYSPIVFVEGLAGEVKVYPNPSQDYFIISTGKDKLDSARLLNAQGTVVATSVATDANEATKVATTGLPSGVYFLHTTVAGKKKITKVVVER